MIDDGRPLLVHLKSALGRYFPQNIAGVGIARDKNVAAVVHKVRHRFDVQAAAEFVHRRRKDDDMIEEIFAVLLKGDGRVVCHLEAALGIRIIRKFLGFPDPDPLVRGTDLARDPSFSHKCIERTKILCLQNKILTKNFSKK
jgi:hypothetical protein